MKISNKQYINVDIATEDNPESVIASFKTSIAPNYRPGELLDITMPNEKGRMQLILGRVVEVRHYVLPDCSTGEPILLASSTLTVIVSLKNRTSQSIEQFKEDYSYLFVDAA